MAGNDVTAHRQVSRLVLDHEPQGFHGALVHRDHGGFSRHDVSHRRSVRGLVERDHAPDLRDAPIATNFILGNLGFGNHGNSGLYIKNRLTYNYRETMIHYLFEPNHKLVEAGVLMSRQDEVLEKEGLE